RRLRDEVWPAEGGKLCSGRDVLALRPQSIEDGHLAGGIEAQAVDQHPDDARRRPAPVHAPRRGDVEDGRRPGIHVGLVAKGGVRRAQTEREGQRAANARVLALEIVHACDGRITQDLCLRLAIVRHPEPLPLWWHWLLRPEGCGLTRPHVTL